MAGGRPTKYTPELMNEAWSYLENYKEEGDLVPTVVGLALDIGISEDTAYEWAKHEDKAEFSELLTRIKNTQQRGLVNGGLGGTLNPAITKMMMTKHGYSDKQEVDMSSKDGTMSPPTPTYVVVDE